MDKIAGVVVLYNPELRILNNINTYSSVDKLFVVDNSDYDHSSIFIPYNKIEYIHLGSNKGIAYALNFAAKRAIHDKFDWLLTMDQDSYFKEDPVITFREEISILDNNKTAILAPVHYVENYSTKLITNIRRQLILTTMTSGNIINLEIFSHVGGFNENFFIDYVDHEYCLRINSQGYNVSQINYLILYHSLGNVSIHNFFGRKISTTNHNSIRRYYITRNRFYTIFKYKKRFPLYFKRELIESLKELIKILAFEKDKLSKCKNVSKGIFHFIFSKCCVYK